MNDVLYTAEEWRNALETAENNEFDPVDSEEDGGPLALWLCDQHTEIKDDPKWRTELPEWVLSSVITVLEDADFKSFSTETFTSVRDSYCGSTSSDFGELVREYVEDEKGFDLPFPGNPSEEDFEKWYMNYVRRDGEVCADSGFGHLFWFQKNNW